MAVLNCQLTIPFQLPYKPSKQRGVKQRNIHPCPNIYLYTTLVPLPVLPLKQGSEITRYVDSLMGIHLHKFTVLRSRKKTDQEYRRKYIEHIEIDIVGLVRLGYYFFFLSYSIRFLLPLILSFFPLIFFVFFPISPFLLYFPYEYI